MEKQEALETAQNAENVTKTNSIEDISKEDAIKVIKELRKEAEQNRKAKNEYAEKYSELEQWKNEITEKEKTKQQKDLEEQGKYQDLVKQLKGDIELFKQENEKYKLTIAEIETLRKQEFEEELQKIQDEGLRNSFAEIGLTALKAVKTLNASKPNSNVFASVGVESVNHNASGGIDVDSDDFWIAGAKNQQKALEALRQQRTKY
jgi:hypothetical protein